MTETIDQRIAERVAGELIALIGPLQRGLRRRTRADLPLQTLSSAQVEVLRVVAARPAISVGEVAAELHLAPNTASTVIGQLSAAGLVERSLAAGDRRSVRVELTEQAHVQMAAWRDRRHRVLGAALLDGDHADRVAIAAALAPLHRLLERLDS
ncbi:MAG TPA: MarR family transcriptional regulator [Gaiellales bacterium]|nr:MarR family transcriptional regulator [Gaiellales bacterium]